MRRKGKTLAEISFVFDVSRERIRQIVAHEAPDVAAAERRTAWARHRHMRIKAAQSATYRSHRQAQRAASALGMSIEQLLGQREYQRLREDLLLMLVSPSPSQRSRGRRYTSDQLLTALTRAHQSIGGARLTAEAYNRWADGTKEPRGSTIAKRFGSWSAALVEAGLEGSRRNRPRTYDDDELRKVLAACFDELGLDASMDDITVWLSRGEGPSAYTMRDRFGSLHAMRLVALAMLCTGSPGSVRARGETYTREDVPWDRIDGAHNHLEAARRLSCRSPEMRDG